MNIEYIVKLDGRILPHVTACTSGINDLVSDKSGRITASGKMVRYMIDRIPSLKLDFAVMPQEEMQPLLESLAKPSFEVEWFVPELGVYKNQQFYCGEHVPKIKSTSPLFYDAMSIELIPYEGSKGW